MVISVNQPRSYEEPVIVTINASIREPDNARDLAIQGNVRLQRHPGAKGWTLGPQIENKIIELCRSNIGAGHSFTQFNIVGI
jgi:hypothetical protein